MKYFAAIGSTLAAIFVSVAAVATLSDGILTTTDNCKVENHLRKSNENKFNGSRYAEITLDCNKSGQKTVEIDSKTRNPLATGGDVKHLANLFDEGARFDVNFRGDEVVSAVQTAAPVVPEPVIASAPLPVLNFIVPTEAEEFSSMTASQVREFLAAKVAEQKAKEKRDIAEFKAKQATKLAAVQRGTAPAKIAGAKTVKPQKTADKTKPTTKKLVASAQPAFIPAPAPYTYNVRIAHSGWTVRVIPR